MVTSRQPTWPSSVRSTTVSDPPVGRGRGEAAGEAQRLQPAGAGQEIQLGFARHGQAERRSTDAQVQVVQGARAGRAGIVVRFCWRDRAIGIPVDRRDLVEGRDLGHVDQVQQRDVVRGDRDGHRAVDGVVPERMGRCRPRQRRNQQQRDEAGGKQASHGRVASARSSASAAWAASACSGGSSAMPRTARRSRLTARASSFRAAAMRPA